MHQKPNDSHSESDHSTSSNAASKPCPTRRQVLHGTLGLSGAIALSGCQTTTGKLAGPEPHADASQGQLKQSIVSWCFGQFGEKWPIDKQIAVAKQLRC